MNLDAYYKQMEMYADSCDALGNPEKARGLRFAAEFLRDHVHVFKVTAHKCDECGHHEIGAYAQDGKFVALRPKDQIIIVKQHSSSSSS